MRRLARLSLYAGTVAAVLGTSKLHASVVADTPYDLTSSFRFAWALGYIVILAVTAYGVGLPDVPRSPRSALAASAAAPPLGALGMSMVQLVAGDALLPRFVVFGSALLLIPWYLVCSLIATGGRSRQLSRDRVLVVSSDLVADELAAELARAPEVPATIVVRLDAEQAAARPDGRRPLLEAASASEATVVVLDRDGQADPTVVHQAAELHERGDRVRTVSLFYEEWLGKLPLSELERVALMFDIGEVHRARYGRVKRLVDIGVGLVALVPLAAVTCVVVVGNVIANRGPLLYRQARTGKGGEEFRMLKFRTMRPHDGPTRWTSDDDPRITPFGRLLRVSHLDELPQVLNILGGDLSVVGPRPEQPAYVAELVEKLPFYDMRHLVRPGLTGWAQVKYHYGSDETDALEKLQYDFYYLRHQSLGLDLRIMGRTIRSVLGREGR